MLLIKLIIKTKKNTIMAEIKIEKKRPIWPSILLGLVVIGLIIYFINIRKENQATQNTSDDYELVDTSNADLISVKENNSTVASFVTFVENSQNMMSLDHEYTHEAIVKLANAIGAMADEIDYTLRADLDQAIEYAEMIMLDPLVSTHANSIRKSTDILTSALKEIQQHKYPGLKNEVAALDDASVSINPDALTLDQQDEVKAYFGKAADLLRKMN